MMRGTERPNCNICGNEITQADEDKLNFRQDAKYEGYKIVRTEWQHRRCPSDLLKCHVCGKPVPDGENVGTQQFPRHDGCYLNLEPDTTEADPSSWIVR